MTDDLKLRQKLEALQMKTVDDARKQRFDHMQRFRRRSSRIGLCLGIFAAAIYGYTIFAMKQETFLDDLEPP